MLNVIRSIWSLLVLAPCLVLWTAGAIAAESAQHFAGRTVEESSPASWPAIAAAPKDAPNVLVVMTDDVGFGSSSTFGGPVPTPTFDDLADKGYRYNRFHTTAVCSPTRASLITGRNPHLVNIGHTTNWPTGYDGYTSVIPDSAATVADLLQANGYSTAMFGKSHLTPEWEISQAGPFDRWPTGLGFQYFYGFLGADMDMFSPIVYENTTPLEPSKEVDVYHFDEDLADKAISWIKTQTAVAPDKPLFMYYATGTAHAPNQAPAEWLQKFRGNYAEGWDAMRQHTFERQKTLGIIPGDAKLSERPETLPQWSSLSEDQKRLYARYMEAYAASLSHADVQIGRVVQALKDSGRYENTLIIYIQGDNGASAEGRMHGRLYEQAGINGFPADIDYALSRIDDIGGPSTYPLVTGGWGWAMNTPFPYYKRVASHLGGTRNAVVMSWPKRIKRGGKVLSQFHHISDVMPTILEAAGIEPVEEFKGVKQIPLSGVSMAYTFDKPDAPSHRRSQVFEVFENLGFYKDGWMASTTPVGTFWDKERAKPVALDDRNWELYHLDSDFSQTRDLAAEHPAKLEQMKQLFWVEAGRNNILPIHNAMQGREGRPTLGGNRKRFRYTQGNVFIPEDSAPHIIGRRFTLSAEVEIPDAGAEGVIVTQGGRFGGYALYVGGGHVSFYYNALPPAVYHLRSSKPLRIGTNRIEVEFIPEENGSAIAHMRLNGRRVGSLNVDRTLKTWISHTEGLDVGIDHGTPVSEDYRVEDSRFTGEIKDVIFELD